MNVAIRKGKVWGTPYDASLDIPNILVDGILVAVVRTADGWIVVARYVYEDPKFPPIGPFPTPEAAMVHIQLSKDRTS